jgi:uncharacterized protein (TIGR02611 family)
VGILGRIDELRTKQILANARPHLDNDESVTYWARVRSVEEGTSGFIYVTDKRVVLHWRGNDEQQVMPWTHIQAWGIDDTPTDGPILGIDSDDDDMLVQIPVDTQGKANNAADLLQRFAELAPFPRRPLSKPGEGTFHPDGRVRVTKARRSLARHTRRVIITVVGIAFIVVGILIVPLPGPWSFILNIAGLAILAREYDWAQDALDWARERYRAVKEKIAARKRS